MVPRILTSPRHLATVLVLVLALCASTTSARVAARETLDGASLAGVRASVSPETLFHTLAADYFIQRDGTIYVQTGDIPAMWLRDSAAQTLPYVRLARARPVLRSWIRAVIAREARNIEVDAYANAFRADYRIWERKWEVDSLAYPVVLAWTYVAATNDRKIFGPRLHRALGRIVATYDCERRHARCSRYAFAARGENARRGPVRENGMIWSAFRASDDPTRYGYNVPEQMLAVTALRDLADLATRGYGDRALAARALALAGGVDRAIARYALTYDFACGGLVYAYEIDGLGGRVTYDDANLPSLLAAPLTGYVSVDDVVYRRTRACVLSPRNPFYYRGTFGSGIGSPHTPSGYVWPLALIARALTSTDRAEVLEQLRDLDASAGDDGLIHESFDPHDPKKFTRAEFGWANAMYAELLFRAAADYPPQRTMAPRSVIDRRMVAESLSVVDRATALANRGTLLRAFERAVPLRVFGPEGE